MNKNQSHVQNVQVVVRCPSCGAEQYEVEFDETELNSTVEFDCDECPARMSVYIDVTVQAEAPQ